MNDMIVSQAEGRGWSSRLLFHATLWAIALALLLVVAPRMFAIHDDFGVSASGLSRLVVSLARTLVAYWPVALGTIVGWLALDGWLLRRLEGGAGFVRWNLLQICLPLLVLVLTVLGLAEPLFRMITRLSE